MVTRFPTHRVGDNEESDHLGCCHSVHTQKDQTMGEKAMNLLNSNPHVVHMGTKEGKDATND